MWLAIAILASLTIRAIQDPAPEPAPGTPGQDIQALLHEFQSELDDWRTELDKAYGSARYVHLAKSHPARSFWPRFEKLAGSGQRRALLWMARHVRRAGFSLEEVNSKFEAIYTPLLHGSTGEPWMEEVCFGLEFAHYHMEGVVG